MTFIVNLNGTILSPFQILMDIAEQIPNYPPQIKDMAYAPICDLNATNDWINLESLGKPVAIRAKAICNYLSSLLKNASFTELAIDVHCNEGSLLSDNLYGILFLAESFKAIQVRFITPKNNQLCIEKNIQALFKQDNITVDFKANDSQVADDRTTKTLNHLQQIRQQTIKKLGFTFDDGFLNQDLIPEFIINQVIGYSWMCLKSGGYGIACNLLELTIKHQSVSNAMQEQLFMHLLMVRFFSHQYALVTESEFPKQFKNLEQAEVRTLQFLKAYSATLSRNLNVAYDFFDKCNINEQMPLTDENSLYQLNLFALSKVLKGDTDTAFKLEFRIRDFIKDNQIETVGLKYVNFINIARLYKKTKEFDLSLEYYNKAYNEISGGGYTTSDHIYYNMNLGSLCEAAGQNEQALIYWVKAAIHWLACTNKYELSWRPRLILCQETLSDITQPVPIEKANSFLFDKMTQLIKICAINISSQSTQPYQFSEDLRGIKKEACLIHKNLVVFTGKPLENPSEHQPRPSESKLSALVSEYMNSVMDIPQQEHLFIIDTQLDTALLQTAEEALAFTQFAHCESCYFNGQWLKPERFTSIKAVRVTLSKGIQSVTPTDKGLSLQYKRSFLNKTLLDPNEIDVVNQLQQNDSLSIDHLPTSSPSIINQLAHKRVVTISYSNH